jgi:hypothetical protein
MKTHSELNTKQLIQQLLKDPDRKSLAKITAELVYLTFLFRQLPKHYFSRFLFKKNRTNIGDYFPSKILYNIKPHFNGEAPREVVDNKLFFDFFFRQFNISLPKIVMFNHRNVFVVDGKPHHVNTVSEFSSLLKVVFTNNKITDSIFIKRTYGTYGGAKIFKLLFTQLSDERLLSDLFQKVAQSSYLFQETVKQHPEMNRLNESCLNTLRLDTFIDLDGKIEIISAYLRSSMVNNYIDNITSGGCGILIDMATGRLDQFAYMSLKDGGISLQSKHPVTQTKFSDFIIPHFEEAKKLVIKVAGYVPDLRLIGWDVAISESGPVLIEGNSDYDMAGTDWACKGARSNPVFKKVLEEVDL